MLDYVTPLELYEASRETCIRLYAANGGDKRDRWNIQPYPGTAAISCNNAQDGRRIAKEWTLCMPAFALDAKLPRHTSKLIAGYTVHELLHALFTDFSLNMHAAQLGLKKLLNCLEDNRIEAIASSGKLSQVSEARSLLEMLNEHVFTQAKASPTFNMSDEVQFSFVLNLVIFREKLGYRGSFPSDWRKRVSRRTLPLFDHALARFDDLRSTADALALAQELAAMAAQLPAQAPEPPRPPEQCEDGEDGEDGEAGDKGEDGEDGEAEAEDKGEDGEAEDKGEDGEDGEAEAEDKDEAEDGEDGEAEDGEDGEAEDGEDGEAEDGEDGEAEDGEDGEAEDGEDGEAEDGEAEDGEAEDGEAEDGEGEAGEGEAEDGRPAPGAGTEDAPQGEDGRPAPGASAGTEDGDGEASNGAGASLNDAAQEYSEVSLDDLGAAPAHEHYMAEATLNAPAPYEVPPEDAVGAASIAHAGAIIESPARLRRDVTNAVKSPERIGAERHQARGRLDLRNIPAIATKAPGAYRRRIEDEGREAAVSLVLDVSASMASGTGRIDAAKAMTLHIGDALKAAGVRFEVITFTTARGPLVSVPKPFSAGWNDATKGAVAALRAKAGTAMLPAIQFAAKRLLAVSGVTRRIILALTDGEDGYPFEANAMNCAMLRRKGVEVAGLGIEIDPSSAPAIAQSFAGRLVRCDRIADLSTAGLATLVKVLDEGAPRPE